MHIHGDACILSEQRTFFYHILHAGRHECRHVDTPWCTAAPEHTHFLTRSAGDGQSFVSQVHLCSQSNARSSTNDSIQAGMNAGTYTHHDALRRPSTHIV